MPRGRPRKVYSQDPVLDELLRKPTPYWDFTDNPLFDADNNLVEDRLEQWRRYCRPNGDGCKYLQIAEEEAPKTGKLHGQGRIIFRRSYRRSQLLKLWPGVHWEPTKAKQDIIYLLKPYTQLLIDYDDRHQGKRSIFAEQREAIENGATIRECGRIEGANGQSIRNCEKICEYYEPERPTEKRHVHLVTDSGAVMPTGVYRLNDMRFWNRYDAHDNIYINQTVCKLTLPQLKMVCGPAPFTVGRGRQARFSHVYISGLDDDERKALDLDSRGCFTPLDLIIRR